MTAAPKDRPSNVIPFPAPAEGNDETAKVGTIEDAWEQMARIALERLGLDFPSAP